jgi:hypothetical protein
MTTRISYNDVHKVLNNWCRRGHITEKHLIAIAREIVALGVAAPLLPSN